MTRSLGPEFNFSCGVYIGQASVEAIPPTANLITPDRIFDVVDHAIPYGRAPVSRASMAMRGLTQILLEQRVARATLLEVPYSEWNDDPNSVLWQDCYALVGASRDQPNVRDDTTDQKDPYGTIIVRGQASKRAPLYLVEQSTDTGGRRLDVLDGRYETFPLVVMPEVNAFSLRERMYAAAYIGARTMDPSLRARVLSDANRYTTPNADALYGAYVFETQGPAGLSAWPAQMAIYSQRKGTIPA